MGLQNNLVFEEIETPELNGNGRNFIEGVGVGIVAGIVALT